MIDLIRRFWLWWVGEPTERVCSDDDEHVTDSVREARKELVLYRAEKQSLKRRLEPTGFYLGDAAAGRKGITEGR